MVTAFWYGIAFLRLLVFIMFSLTIGVIQCVYWVFTKDNHTIPMIFHKGVCEILNIQVETEGKHCEGRSLFLVNHLSWADIMVIGSVIPAVFVAKSDVKSWPFLGQLARLQNTIFIERTKAGIQAGQEKIADAVGKGASIILFPEGTNSSTLGEILPFKSSYVSIAEGSQDFMVQPVALKVEGVGGNSNLDQTLYERYAWGDVGFVSHLLRFMATPSFQVSLTFCPPLDPKNLDRKGLTKQAEEVVASIVKIKG